MGERHWALHIINVVCDSGGYPVREGENLRVSLGVTFVLFVGIIMGHFGITIDPSVIHFFQEFGLILFVYSVGMQVGPGFFSSFKQGGVR